MEALCACLFVVAGGEKSLLEDVLVSRGDTDQASG